MFKEAFYDFDGNVIEAVEQVRIQMQSSNTDEFVDDDIEEYETLVNMAISRIKLYEEKTYDAIDDLYDKFNI